MTDTPQPPPWSDPAPPGGQPWHGAVPGGPTSYVPAAGAPGYGPPPSTAGTNGLAIASLVLGILWLYWLGSLLAVVFGHIALRQIRRFNGAREGRGLAIAGAVLGWTGLAVLAVAGAILVAVSDDLDDLDDAGTTAAGPAPLEDDFTGDGVPPEDLDAAPEEPVAADLARCELRFDLSDRIASAFTYSGLPAEIDLSIHYIDGRSESLTVQHPGSPSSGTAVVDEGADTCAVVAVREADATDGTDALGPAPRAPSEVVVLVVNASGLPGSATEQSAALADGGYALMEPTDSPDIVQETEVLAAAGFEAEAAALAAAIGAPAHTVGPMPLTLPFDPSGANVVVLLGPDLARP